MTRIDSSKIAIGDVGDSHVLSREHLYKKVQSKVLLLSEPTA